MPTDFIRPASADQPELFFALVAPIGVDTDHVVGCLETELCAVGYELVRITKLSELLHSLEPFAHLAEEKGDAFEDVRIESHMDAGDRLRRDLDNGGALAALAVNAVRETRGDTPRPGIAYLFRSLKHPDEVELLRAVYETSLVVISIYEPEDARQHRLVQRLQRSGRGEAEANEHAERLIDRDQRGGERDPLGQNVRDTFPRADFFLDASKDVRPQLARLVELLFGHPFRSPTRDEVAMALAFTSARRSADLSRQVGAAIVAADGEVVALGCNEVPKPRGGVYWDGDDPDLRDYRQGSDPNAIVGRELLLEIFASLKEQGWLAPPRSDQDPGELERAARELGVFKHARVTSLIEFGRIVHAEMNALAAAARRGAAVQGARLYCTTLPCHGCARHLLAAGLSEVVYIEPYPKSLAAKLYAGAITLAGKAAGDHLLFRPFTGVAPARYHELFDYGRRKDRHGYATRWDPKSARPRPRRVANPHLLVERDLCVNLQAELAKLSPPAKTETP